jgi:MOSC domain-containing protein YiiM
VTDARVVAVCRSEQKGTRKQPFAEARLIADWGLEGDAHAGRWHRQVSLLADESYETARRQWGLAVEHGDFAENVTTRGIVLKSLPIGTRLEIGDDVLVEVTQIGKKCHSGCEIMQLAGKCIFPQEGIFGRVLQPGIVRAGDPIRIRLPDPV